MWNESYKKGDNYLDQPSINNIIYKNKIDIDILDGSLNCQVGYMMFPLDIISKAIIIHYLNTRVSHLNFSKKDFSNLDYDSIVKHPKDIFHRIYAIDYETNKEFVESELYYQAYNIFCSYKRIFHFINRICDIY